jgi:hypothetical protein
MAVLTLNVPIETTAPVIRVDNQLGVGRHRFSLVVLDAQGRSSDANLVVVTVREPPPHRPLASPLPRS